MNFHCRLKQRRGELNISIRKICKDLSIAKSTYEGWETDSFPRKPILYKRLADHLKVSTEYLMFGTNENKALEELMIHFKQFIKAFQDAEGAGF